MSDKLRGVNKNGKIVFSKQSTLEERVAKLENELKQITQKLTNQPK